MNQELFNQAQAAYVEKDYQSALNLFTSCLTQAADSNTLEPGEGGKLSHQIGNCLVKLGNIQEAINAYLQARNDTAYDAQAAVCFNLGTAFASQRDYESAVQCFEQAVSDPNYPTPYKAYSGMGNAYMKMGKSAEAGIAFREAALDPKNGDPTKALLNLGVCFMALNRPADAITSYESALQFDMKPNVRNKLYANMGQAYVATGQMQKAVECFEQALTDKTYFLSDSASVDYQRAVAAVSQGVVQVDNGAMAAAVGVAGATGAMAGAQYANDYSGLDVMDNQQSQMQMQQYNQAQYGQGGYGAPAGVPMGQPGEYANQGYPGNQGDDAFFTASDHDIEQWSKGAEKKERKRKNTGLKVILIIFIIVLLLFGGAVFAYTQGYGWPMQDAVAKQVFQDPTAAQKYFSSELSEAEIKNMCARLVSDPDVEIVGIERGMSTSAVYVKASTGKGGEVTYVLNMVRSMIGWKISSIDLYFTSTGAGNGNGGSSSASPSSSPSASPAASASSGTSGSVTGSTSGSTATGTSGSASGAEKTAE